MVIYFHFKPLKWLLLVKKILVVFSLLALTVFTCLYFYPTSSHDYFLPTSTLSIEKQSEPKKLENLSILNTNIEPAKVLLSYLKNSLLFLGVSDRPDQHLEKKQLILTIKDSNETTSFLENEKIYLHTERDIDHSELTFHFCEQKDANFWLTLSCNKEDALNVVLGKEVDSKITDVSFTLTKTSLPSRKLNWQIDEIRVDPSFLTRKQVKWIGQDLFLKRHGGDDFLYAINKERLNFSEEYSCFVQEGDFLIWKDHRWQAPTSDSHNYPLLFVKKIEEKLMHFIIWSTEGDMKCALTLPKYPEIYFNETRVTGNFNYLGAKSWKEFLFEVSGKRVFLRQGDWWLYHSKEWKRLLTPEEIDAYVKGELKGDLFIIDGVKRVKGNQVLIGHIFNPLRTKMSEIEIPMKQKSPLQAKEIPGPQFVPSEESQSDNPSLCSYSEISNNKKRCYSP